jgi:hypothetical protein
LWPSVIHLLAATHLSCRLHPSFPRPQPFPPHTAKPHLRARRPAASPLSPAYPRHASGDASLQVDELAWGPSGARSSRWAGGSAARGRPWTASDRPSRAAAASRSSVSTRYVSPPLSPPCSSLRLLRPSDWDRVFVESFRFGAALILFHRSVLSVRCLGSLGKISDWLSVIRVPMLCSQLWVCWQM